MSDLVRNPEDRFSRDMTQIAGIENAEVGCCGCTAGFVSDLVGNPEFRFCCDTAHIESLDMTAFIHTFRLLLFFLLHPLDLSFLVNQFAVIEYHNKNCLLKRLQTKG